MEDMIRNDHATAREIETMVMVYDLHFGSCASDYLIANMLSSWLTGGIRRSISPWE